MILKTIIFTLIPLIVLDAIWLSLMKPFYTKFIGHLMSPTVVWLPIVIFYILYSIGISVFVVSPALKTGTSFLSVFLLGALFGLVAYGVYDFTNHATLRDWSTMVTIIDLAWGAVLTGSASVISVYVAKLFL